MSIDTTKTIRKVTYNGVEIPLPSYEDGYAAGWAVGNSEGFDMGKQAEYDAFWDALQDNGNRTVYNYAFAGRNWVPSIFKPKYPIVVVRGTRMFEAANWITDISELDIDFSQATELVNLFAYSVIQKVGIIDLRSMTELYNVFTDASQMKTIEKIILKEDGSQTFRANCFRMPKLENVVLEGKIGQNGFDVSSCSNLTHDSLMSIINALKDYSATPNTHTVTLGATNLNKLSAAEKAVATGKGWTLA